MQKQNRVAAIRFLSLLLVVLSPEAGAQTLPPLDEYHIRAFDVGDGLLNSDVIRLAQTADGFLYIASGRGLARFDGHEFRRVPLPGMQSLFLQWIHLDSRDRLWVLSTRNELGFLEQGRFHRLPPPPVRIGTLTEAAGELWAGGEEGLVRITDDAAEPFVRVEIPANSREGVVGVYEVPGGELILVSRRGLTRVIPDSAHDARFRFEPLSLPKIARDSTVDLRFVRVDERGLWIATPRGVHVYRFGAFDKISAKGVPVRVDSLGWRGVVTPLRIGEPYHLPMHAIETTGSAFEAAPIIGGLRGTDGTLWLVFAEPGRGPHHLVRIRRGAFERVALREYLSFRRISHLIEDH